MLHHSQQFNNYWTRAKYAHAQLHGVLMQIQAFTFMSGNGFEPITAAKVIAATKAIKGSTATGIDQWEMGLLKMMTGDFARWLADVMT